MSTIKNLFVIVARDISTDATDQMTSIMKIIERFWFRYDSKAMKAEGLTLGKNPVLFQAKYSVATSWFFDSPNEKDLFLTFVVSVVDPAGKDLSGPSQEHLLPAGIDRINMNFNLDGLPVTEGGKYKLVVKVLSKDGKKLSQGECPFVVELMEEWDEAKKNTPKK